MHLIVNLKGLFIVLTLILFGNTVSMAEETSQEAARQVITTFQATLLEVMKQGKQLGYEGRYKELKPAIKDSHDLTKITRIVIGNQWKKLSTEQKKEMIQVFTELSIASYAHNFKEFSGESFKFESEEETARGGMIVRTFFLIPGEKDVSFDYMLKKKGDSWLIINIIANGVSDLALKRSEYSSILKREGFDVLIAKINEKIVSYSEK